jgi:beta-N-acetylhexosaminidase
MKKYRHIGLILLLVMLSACNFNNNQSSSELIHLPPDDSEQQTKVEKLLESMTLEEKIGQLFIIRPDALQLTLTPQQINDPIKYGVSELDLSMIETLKKYHVGGIALFNKNMVTPTQLTNFINNLQLESAIPLFVGVDEEGGSVSRIANASSFNVPKFENMQKIGDSGNIENAKNVGKVIGSYLKEYGFNLDFAPVADINTNPENIVIGNRSFGDDPKLVSTMVAAVIFGLHESKIMSSIKHFPGHGDTKGDTHTGFVSTEKTWDQLKQTELIPFINSLDTTDMVMISHISTPNITSDDLPCSLSNEMIEKKLQHELGFKGVVISDSMSMGAITQKYSASESAVLAIVAGIDIILMPEDFVVAYKGIYDAVKDGIISESRIDVSVLKILNLKDRYELLK